VRVAWCGIHGTCALGSRAGRGGDHDDVVGGVGGDGYVVASRKESVEAVYETRVAMEET
jgi:hypothetical protein